jgi:hypothetical protein
MTDTKCEPPEELRGRDGWHWVQWGSDAPECQRWRKTGHWYGQHMGLPDWRYLAPAATPATVRALVEALEEVERQCVKHNINGIGNIGHAALARAKAEGLA